MKIAIFLAGLLFLSSPAFAHAAADDWNDGSNMFRIEEKDRQELIGLLNNPNPSVRLGAAKLLGGEYLIKALKDKSLFVRYFAVKRLLLVNWMGMEGKIKDALVELENKDDPMIAFLIANTYQDTDLLKRLYRSKDRRALRSLALFSLLIYSDERQRMQLIPGALNDSQLPVRLVAESFLYDLQKKDAEAKRIYEKAISKDPLMKQFAEYIDCLYSEGTVMYASAVFDDKQEGMQEVFMAHLVRYYSETENETLLPLFFEATKSILPKIRLAAAVVLVYYGNGNDEIYGVLQQSLEEYIQSNDERKAFTAIMAIEDIPLEAMPDLPCLNRIFADTRPLIHWGIIEIVRQKVYFSFTPGHEGKRQELADFLKANDPMDEFNRRFLGKYFLKIGEFY